MVWHVVIVREVCTVRHRWGGKVKRSRVGCLNTLPQFYFGIAKGFLMSHSGFVYGSDSSGFREAGYGRPYRGRSSHCPDRHLVGDTAAGVPSPRALGVIPMGEEVDCPNRTFFVGREVWVAEGAEPIPISKAFDTERWSPDIAGVSSSESGGGVSVIRCSTKDLFGFDGALDLLAMNDPTEC